MHSLELSKVLFWSYHGTKLYKVLFWAYHGTAKLTYVSLVFYILLFFCVSRSEMYLFLYLICRFSQHCEQKILAQLFGYIYSICQHFTKVDWSVVRRGTSSRAFFFAQMDDGSIWLLFQGITVNLICILWQLQWPSVDWFGMAAWA